MEISEETVIIDCSRLKSAVWKDFDRVRRGDACVAVCKHCNKKLSGSSTSGTSHLRNHLIRCRRRTNHDVSQMLTSSKGKKKEASLTPVTLTYDHDDTKPDITNLITTNYANYEQNLPLKESLVSIANGQFDNKRSRFDLARMIILHGYPLTMVEHVGFRIFVRKLQPLFELATLDDVIADCKEIYLKEKQKVCELFDNLPGKISLSIDTWDAKGDDKYLCLTAHSVDDTWALKKKIISFVHFDVFQTDDVVSEAVMSRLMEWDIDRKLFSMTCDNCVIHDGIVCKVRERLSQNRFLLCNGQLFEVRCAANLIKIMVEDCLEALSSTINKIRESIRYIRSSQATNEKFNEMLQEVGVNAQSQKSLYLDNPHHWNSTYVMLDVALEYREAFSRLQEDDFSCTMCPSDDEWSQANTVTNFLKLFVEVSTAFARSKIPTANIYFSEVCHIHLQLIDWCQNQDECISSLSLKMKSKFDDYWKKCSLSLAVAVILDPRYKMKLVEYYYPQIYGGDAPDCVDIVSNCLRALYNGHDVYSTLASNSHVGNGGNDTRDRLTGFDRFLHETSQSQNVKSDLDKYLEEPLFPRSNDFNILNWWKVHSPRYPVLSMMARNILGIPMSKIRADSVFDNDDRVLDQYRSSLNADTLQALICTQDWMQHDLEADLKASSSNSSLAICYDAN